MTIRIDSNCVHVIGSCPVEEAEVLLTALQDKKPRKLDLSQLIQLHTAVAQILAASDADIIAFPDKGFALDFLLPAIGKIFQGTK